MSDNNYQASICRLGIPDKYINHGTQKELWEICEFDTKSIVKKIKKILSIKTSKKKFDQKIG